MRPQDLAKTLCAISICVGLSVQSRAQNSTIPGGASCVVKLARIQFNCPAGWKIVEENDRGTTIGDFDRPDKTGNLTIPSGRGSLTVYPMPRIYKSFKEWVYAASKNAPEAIRKNETLTNKKVGSVNVVCFSSPDSQGGLIYASYFFEINTTPVNLELHYPRTAPDSSEYRTIPTRIIENLEPYHRYSTKDSPNSR
jgi:hypothetical protein